MNAEGPGDGNKERPSWASRAWTEVKSWFRGKPKTTITVGPIEEVNFSIDQIASDWEDIKEKSGYNHAKKYYDTHDFGLPGVAFGKGGGSNLHGTQGKPRRDVPWIDVEWLLDIIGPLKVGPPSTVPGVGDVHTPDTFGRHGKDNNINLEESKPTQQPVELIKFTKKWYINNGGHFKRSKEASVRVSKDTMIDPATREYFEKLNKEDSIRNTK